MAYTPRNQKPNVNPANVKEKRELPANFQPMSQGVKKLEVPEREGFHRRWFRGEPKRIAQAQRAGYTFVSEEDVDLNNFDLGGDAKTSGNSDMGTRVSVISGDSYDKSGQPGRMYLMECPIEYYEASRQVQEDRNDDIAEALSAGTLGKDASGETFTDAQRRYLKTATPELFVRKNRE